MKRLRTIPIVVVLMMISNNLVFAQDITVVAPTSEIAEGLDLYAVAEIFKESKNLEEFENYLNDPEIGINNLDLDGDGYIDYIRVVEQVTDYTHVIILQVPLAEDEFQDVATIEIEKNDEEEYNMQVHGNEMIYGPDYYIIPAYVHVHIRTWPIIIWIYRPVYRPYHSVFYFGYYPHWWGPHRHVAVRHVYYDRTEKYRRENTFKASRRSRVRTVHHVKYIPNNSKIVKPTRKTIHTSRKPVYKKEVSRINNSDESKKRVYNNKDVKKKKQVATTTKSNIKKVKIPKVKKETSAVSKPVRKNSSVKMDSKPKEKKTVTTKTSNKKKVEEK